MRLRQGTERGVKADVVKSGDRRGASPYPSTTLLRPHDVRGCGAGGLLGWFPRVLRRTPLLRGPRVALVRLFEPGVSSCLSLEEEEGLEGRQVGISGGGGAFACPRPGTHSRSQPSQDNSVPSGSHREERCLREFLAARTPHTSINEEKRSQGRQRDPGRIGLGADPSDKLAEGSTSLGPVARGTGVGGVRRN